MKKILVIAAAALAFAACSKSEVFMTEPEAISFNPYSLTTKALIDGTIFPETDSFKVYAFADVDGKGLNFATPLMDDVTIAYKSDWKASQGTYLWPATGTADFYAYYPTSLNAVFDTLATPKGLKITGISLGDEIGKQIDPLVAATPSQIAKNKPIVSVVFKHITSQVVVAARDVTKTKSLRGKIFISRVEFKNMKTSGDYAEGSTPGSGQWSNVNTIKNFVPFTGSAIRLDTTENYLSAGSYINSLSGSAAFVVVPNTLMASDSARIEVTYRTAPYQINGFEYPAMSDTTVVIPLFNRLGNKVGASFEADNTFQNGRRYIFHLGLSMDGANNEIMFAPSVSEWTNEDINGITIDAVNVGLLNQQ